MVICVVCATSSSLDHLVCLELVFSATFPPAISSINKSGVLLLAVGHILVPTRYSVHGRVSSRWDCFGYFLKEEAGWEKVYEKFSFLFVFFLGGCGDHRA